MPKITNRLIDTTPCPKEGQIFLRDTDLRGFAVRIAEGRKIFIMENNVHGRSLPISLGRCDQLTIDQARDMARTLIDAKLKLTKRLIEKAPYPGRGQIFLRDAELRGFALRITKGQKTFILEKNIQGRGRRLALGPYGPLTVDQARDMARDLIGRIAKGEDPAEDRMNRRREMTFGKLIELYLDRHAPKKKSASKDQYILDRFLTPWKLRRLSDLSRKDVVDLHLTIGKKSHYTANRAIALLRKMFNLARIWGIFEGDNPAAGMELFREVKRDRFIQPLELPELIKALAKETDPFIQGVFMVSLLTGARIGEVLTMKWADVDLERALWRIPVTKAGRPHYVPLPGPVVALLEALPRLNDNLYVFPGRKKQRHLVNVARAWNRIRKRSKLHDLRIHDLRRTLGSWLAGSGASLPLIGKILNHSQPSTTAIYARFHLDPVRAALEANAQQMILIGGDLPIEAKTDGKNKKR
jgi:integrase